VLILGAPKRITVSKKKEKKKRSRTLKESEGEPSPRTYAGSKVIVLGSSTGEEKDGGPT